MHGHARLVSGVFCLALVASQPPQAAAASPVGLADDPWEIVPDETLRDLRGGIDLGSLVANFAIERSVEVDGVVVARMQIVISNLDRLGNGGMPTVSISGPLAQLVQVLAANPNAASANGASATAGAAAALAAATTPASSVPAGSTRPTVAPNSSATASSASPAPQSTTVVGGGAASISSGGNGGSVSATGTQTGSTAQFGNAIATATTATGATQATTGSAPSSTTPAVATASTGSSGTAGSAPANTNSQASSAGPATVAVAGNSAAASPTAAASANASSTQPSRIIPLGTTGQVVVVSNLPNATAITTAVQNSVRAATIQTQTTISATLNSLQVLNALTLGNAIRQQIATGP